MQWVDEFQLHAVAPKRLDGTFTVELTWSVQRYPSVEFATYCGAPADVIAKLTLRLLSKYVITVLLLYAEAIIVSEP